MHPNTYLKSFWTLELKPQIFVAMSFSPEYESRYENIIAPAIAAISVNDQKLEPYRVDISQSGDSILSDISEGIAHSRMILADISSVGKDSVTGKPYRNGNVMYEVGIALASRQPSDVLLVRDDSDNFLFDVSTIPHLTMSFVNEDKSKGELTDALMARLQEQSFIHDARVRLAISSLSGEELLFLRQSKEYDATTVWARETAGIANWYALATSRLLDKGVIQLAGEFDSEKAAFRFTPLGLEIKNIATTGLRKFHDPDIEVEEDTEGDQTE